MGFYLDGGGIDYGTAIAVDSIGSVAVAGWTNVLPQGSTPPFPTTLGVYDTARNGAKDAFASKFDSTGTALLYSTYSGGSQDDDILAMAANSSFDLFVAGSTRSSDFPLTANPLETCASRDAIVLELNNSGTLGYSTCLGGAGVDDASAIAIDANNEAVVVGTTDSPDFPLRNAFLPTNRGTDAFVTKINSTGTGLVFSTFLGGSIQGSAGDGARAVAVDQTRNIYVAGATGVTDFSSS